MSIKAQNKIFKLIISKKLHFLRTAKEEVIPLFWILTEEMNMT